MFGIDLNPLDWFADAVNSAVSNAFDYLVNWIVDACNWLGQQVAALLVGAGKPSWSSSVFGQGGPASLMLYLAYAVLVGGAMLQLIATQWKPQSAVAETLIELPTTAIAVGSVYLIANMVLGVTDAVSQHLFADGISQALQSGLKPAAGIVPFVRLLIALVLVILLLVLYIEQLIRAHLLEVVIVLLPLAIAGRTWAPARYLSSAMIKVFIALAMTPVLAGLSLSIAASNFSGGAGELDLPTALAGIAGLLVTTFAPFLIFKLFPVGAEGHGGIGLAAAAAGYGVGKKVAGAAAGGGAGGASGGGSGGGSGFGAAQQALTTAGSSAAGGGAGGGSAPGGGSGGGSSSGSGGGSSTGGGSSPSGSSPGGLAAAAAAGPGAPVAAGAAVGVQAAQSGAATVAGAVDTAATSPSSSGNAAAATSGGSGGGGGSFDPPSPPGGSSSAASPGSLPAPGGGVDVDGYGAAASSTTEVSW